jgi:hypothetical protein
MSYHADSRAARNVHPEHTKYRIFFVWERKRPQMVQSNGRSLSFDKKEWGGGGLTKYTRFNSHGNSTETSFNKETVSTSALFVPKGGKKGQGTALVDRLWIQLWRRRERGKYKIKKNDAESDSRSNEYLSCSTKSEAERRCRHHFFPLYFYFPSSF